MMILDDKLFNNLDDLNNTNIRRAAEKLNKLKLIKFDITETTEEHSKYLQSMMVFGPPALFFFNNEGNEIIDARIVGFMGSEDFLKVLKLVKN